MSKQYTLDYLIARLVEIQEEYNAPDLPVSILIEIDNKQVERAVGDVAVSVLTTTDTGVVPKRVILLPINFD